MVWIPPRLPCWQQQYCLKRKLIWRKKIFQFHLPFVICIWLICAIDLCCSLQYNVRCNMLCNCWSLSWGTLLYSGRSRESNCRWIFHKMLCLGNIYILNIWRGRISAKYCQANVLSVQRRDIQPQLARPRKSLNSNLNRQKNLSPENNPKQII